MNITLYTTSDDPIVANKTLTNGVSITGTFRATVDVLRPTFTVEATSVLDVHNYAYISDFGRYYYITAKRYITSNLIELSLYVDVRKSFLLELKLNSGIVVKQENNYDMYLPDNIPVSSKKALSIKKFSTCFTKGSETKDRPIVMLVLGGGEPVNG